MIAVGGYFGLELPQGSEYHTNAIKLNTGRNALEYILIAKKYKKIYLPYYTCDVLLQPIKKLNIAVEFYFIDENFEPIFDFSKIKINQVFLYTNYFGLKDVFISSLKNKSSNVIIDNAQSFYSEQKNNFDTFYSARKFFGVSDGAYLYCSKHIKSKLKQDTSYQRFQHLLIRVDESAEAGYSSFVKNDDSLNDKPVLEMSKLTHQLLQGINYKSIAKKRRENFNYLENTLGNLNKLNFSLTKNAVPMVYPFYTKNVSLRKKLIEHKIYIAKYWGSVLKQVKKNTVEYDYVNHLIHLPIDQRLHKTQLDNIIDSIKHEY